MKKVLKKQRPLSLLKYRDLSIYSNRPSNGARELSSKIGCRYLREASPKSLLTLDGNLLVNWGNTLLAPWVRGTKLVILNKPAAIKRATSKVYSYGKFKEAGVPTLEFTTSRKQAEQWLRDSRTVLARRDGLSGGKAISIVEKGGVLDDKRVDFYAAYLPKTHEYRVHVFKGRVIDITQKKRSSDNGTDSVGENSYRTIYQRVVRSHENGWVHAHENLHLPSDARGQIEQAAIKAVEALGLDFGAVDVLAQFSKKRPDDLRAIAVCEVNTAPGLENTVTFEAYKNAIVAEYEATSVSRSTTKTVRR